MPVLIHVILPLCGGLFIFLGGMKLMEAALRHLAGPFLTRWLNRATVSLGGVCCSVQALPPCCKAAPL